MQEDNNKKMLNYSYIKLDSSNYLHQFLRERRLQIKKFQININQIENSLIHGKFHTITNYLPKNIFTTKGKVKKTDYLITKDILLKILKKMIIYKSISNNDVNNLFLFQKKFEIGHKIYQKYDLLMKKIDSDYKDILIYAILANIFFLYFIETKDFNLLNSAIKLNDLILKSGWKISQSEKKTVSLSLLIEITVLENFI